MKKFVFVFAALALTVGVAVTGALAKPAKKSAGILACGLMPDTKTSTRWQQYDQPALVKAFKALGVSARVVNAQGDPQKQKTQADQCIADGAKVLIIAPIDSGSAAAIEKAALAKGVKSIDYDRQVEGGVAALYASFDGHQVGVLQGTLVSAALKGKKGAVVAELNGGQEDANSFLFKGGYDAVLKPLYANGTLKKGPDQFVPAWDNQKAGTIFNQMLIKTANKIDGVAAANDGIANAVVVDLQAHKLKPIPLSGQDATTQGVQNIIAGWQTMSVCKDERMLATGCGGGGQDRQGPAAPDDRLRHHQGPQQGGRVPDQASVDHEGELEAAVHERVREEQRHLQRQVHAVLQVADADLGAPRAGRPQRSMNRPQ